MERKVLLDKLADTILVLLVPILVSTELQNILNVTFGVWGTVAGCGTWIVGLFLIWRRPRRAPE